MSTRDDVIESAHHFRDASKDCCVELAVPETYVVTATVGQAWAVQQLVAELIELKAAATAKPAPRKAQG